MHQNFYSIQKSIMDANYAKTDRVPVGGLDEGGGLQQATLVQSFCNFHNNVMKHR